MLLNKQLLYNLSVKNHSLLLTGKETKMCIFAGQTLSKSTGAISPKSLGLFAVGPTTLGPFGSVQPKAPKPNEGDRKSKLSVKVYSSKLTSEPSPLMNSYSLNPKHSLLKGMDYGETPPPFMSQKASRDQLAKKTVKFVPMEYQLENFQRSNQDTCITHKPAVSEGDWVQSGDILTDCASSVGGELSLGQNLLIAYMPWEGYNFEDAILISERLVIDDLYTSVHIERYEMEIHQTNLGTEEITREIPDVTDTEIKNLDSFGVVKIGSWVEEGDILVGKITPIPKNTISPYQKLLYTILEKQVKPFRDSSLRAPKGVKAKVIDIKYFSKAQTNKKGAVSAYGFTAAEGGLNLSAFLGSEGSVGNGVSSKKTKKTPISSSKTPRKGQVKSTDMKTVDFTLKSNEKPSFQQRPFSLEIQKTSMATGLKSSPVTAFRSFKLKTNTFIKALNNQYSPLKTRLSTLGPEGSVPSVKPITKGNRSTKVGEARLQVQESPFEGRQARTKTLKKSYYLPLICPVKGKPSTTKDLGNKYIKLRNFTSHLGKLKALNELKLITASNKTLLGKNATGLGVSEAFNPVAFAQHNVHELQQIETIHIYLAETRKIQVGDKMSGRHGNKGIVSQILPIQDMPYLPDGTPIDMVLNPLGVPSRMNVGQIYECLLGLAGKFLGENYKVPSFDEIYGPEASRSFVFNKLYEARKSTGFNWLFDPNNPGKMRLYDGRTGSYFDQAVTVGRAYILRLVHMVDDKIHMRSTGPYSLVTQQPLRGRSKEGGQRLGEMEVWALEGYGAAFTLLEMLTIKSDDMTGRMTLWSNLILNKDISIGTPESFKVLICELQALCLDIGLFRPAESLSQSPLNTGGRTNNQLTEVDSLINLP